MANKKIVSVYFDEELFNKIKSQAKISGNSISATAVNFINAGIQKKNNEYKEIISFLKERDENIVKSINDALTHFFELTQSNPTGTNPIAEPKKDGDAYAKAFFDRMSKL